ncbi:MAG: HAD family hydrolase [Thermoguttaceae bacterium]
MIKCVMFDMDGTIADTIPLCVAAFRAAVEPILGRTVSDEEITNTFGPSEEGTIQALIPDRHDYGLEQYFVNYRDLHEKICSRLFDGIDELIKYVKNKGLILALVTGKGKKSLDISVDFFGMHDVFDAIETGSPHGPNKPEGMRSILNLFELAPNEVVYIGDAPTDIVAAKEVGIPIISAAWATTVDIKALKALQPDKICYSVEELNEHLKNILG